MQGGNGSSPTDKGDGMIKRQFMQPKDMWARVENGELLYVPVVTVHGTDHAHVYLAGQMARKVTGEIVTKGDMRAQIRTTCENIEKGLAYAGATFDDVAKDRGMKPSDTELGTVTKADIIDPAVADAAFALKSGETSAPVKGRFGIALLQVGKIEPGEEKTYEQVAAQIKNEIAASRVRTEIGSLRDKIEDERAGGSTLAETAKKLGLKAITIEAVDRSGRGPDGKPVAGLPQTPNVVSAAFASDVGVDTEALQMPNGGYLYFDVTGVTPSRERSLDEVKDQVAERWRDDEIAKRLQAKADDLVGKLKAGTPFAQLASEAGLKLATAGDLQRGKSGGFLPAKVVDAVFRTPKGVPASAEGDKSTERFIFRVTEIIDPTLDASSPEGKSISDTLQNSYGEDVVTEYIGRLENDFGVTVNQPAFNQVIGGGGQQ